MANDVARKLRQTMTRQEVKLWVKLRELRAIGHHFRRQSPLADHVVDFECRRSRIVIEVDGHQHGFDEHRRRDNERDRVLQELGYRVLRFGNYEVDREFDGVLEAIRFALEAAPHPAASRPPSPGGGDDTEPVARMSLLLPMLAHIGWVFLLYVWLTVARQQAVRSGEVEYGSFARGEEPHHVARITRNLANQFELPVVFYALVVLLVATNKVTTIDIVAAWLFVAGRVIHTLVQTLTDNVPLRGQVFLINFAGVAVLAGHVALLALDGLWR